MTLVELVATLALIAILAGLGLPSLNSFVSGTHAMVVGNRLLADLALARTQAIMRNSPGVMCPSTDGSTCTGGDDWSQGWIVFVDTDGDDQRSASEPLLSAVSHSDVGGLHVVSSVDRTKVRFLPSGIGGGDNLTIHVCDGDRLKRDVVVNVSGRARLDQPNTIDPSCG